MKKMFVGVDFSKEKVDVAIIFADGLSEFAHRVFNEFKTTTSGYRSLLKWVEAKAGGKDFSQWLFCGENTGDYSLGLCNFLYGMGCDMWLENAKSIKDASGIRRLKSDRADASMIAEYAMRNCDKAILYKPLSESLSDLRALYLYRQSVVKNRCCFQVRTGEKKLCMENAASKDFIIQSGERIVSECNNEIARIDQKITELIESHDDLKKTYEIITSVPGIGTQNAVAMIVYTHNFEKFGFNSRKIACYYGIAPFGKDSGTSVHSDPHVHFMANRQLKAMLTQAALAAVRFNPNIAAYYARMLKRGKKKQVALNNVKNKLIHLMTALVREKSGYDKNYKISA